jgi:hypothetical protein
MRGPIEECGKENQVTDISSSESFIGLNILTLWLTVDDGEKKRSAI